VRVVLLPAAVSLGGIVAIAARCGAKEPIFSVAQTKRCLEQRGHAVRGPYRYKDVPGRSDLTIDRNKTLSFFRNAGDAHGYSHSGSEPTLQRSNVVFDVYASAPITKEVQVVEACLRRS
jgi:hypothetical protein